MLLPREHGAYGQLVLPLVTAFAVSGVTLPAALVAAGAVSAFLAHEPLVVLLGRRGARARRDLRRAAAVWLFATGVAACAAGLAALWLVPAALRAGVAVPLIPAAWVGVAIARNREKTESAEVAAALAFSLAAVAVCLAAEAPASTAFAVGLAFAAVFVSHTLAVRCIILRARGGGDPRAAGMVRAAVLAWTAAAAVALGALAVRGVLPWVTLVSATPGLGAAIYLALHPPAPARLRSVGWTLAATAASTALVLAI